MLNALSRSCTREWLNLTLVLPFPLMQDARKVPKPGGFFAQTPEGTKYSAKSFGDLKLSRPLLKACEALGYSNPTPIQVCALLCVHGAASLRLWTLT